MLVLVTLERERSDIVDNFKKALLADYEQFTGRFFYENADIKRFKTMVVIDRAKATLRFH